MTMISKKTLALSLGALALGAVIAQGRAEAQAPAQSPAPAQAQTPAQAQAPAPAAGSGRKAVDERKAVYALVGASFRPLGAVLKGEAQYDAADAKKRLARLAVLAPYTTEVFSDASNLGEPESKARPEIWTQKADFSAKQKAFLDDVAALVAANDKDQAFSDGVSAALTKVAQDCKGCHDDYKLK